MKLFLSVALFICIISCNNAGEIKPDNTSTSNTTDTSGWISLFDNKTTNGWHTYGKTTIGSAWKVADGTLYLDTTQKEGWQINGGGDICTDDEFENFHLKLEWKISKNGNSGIIFNAHEDTVKYKHAWETGPEMQVLDNAGHNDSKISNHRAGDLYDIISCSKETVKPVGEWNQAEIKMLNGKLDFYLNGENVVSTTMWDSAWVNSLKTTKWKNHKDFGSYKKGKIALQDHGNMVWYRNIMIKRL